MKLRMGLGVAVLCLATVAGSCRAGFEEGLAAFNRKDYKVALKEWQPLASQGHVVAQYNLGVMYANGRGVPQDFKEALRWYRLAAERGNANAQSDLGYMYSNGRGVPQDFKEALRWYRLAADQEYAIAQHNLGVMYEHGQGVPQDFKEAVRWYRLAADQGFASAQANLGYMYDNGRGVPQDYREAIKWYRLAAERGDANAQNNLGVMFEHGQGGTTNRVAAYALYNLSAANDPSSDNKATANRSNLAESMPVREIEAAQELTRELAKPGNFLKALDRHTKNPPVKEKPVKRTAVDDNPSFPTPVSGDSYPARPAKRPGVVSCNTRCNNADCWRTYDDGQKVRFIAKRKFDAFSGEWKYDSGSC